MSDFIEVTTTAGERFLINISQIQFVHELHVKNKSVPAIKLSNFDEAIMLSESYDSFLSRMKESTWL